MRGWKCQEFAALWECGLTEFPCCLCFQKCQAQGDAALETGQKGPSDGTEMAENSLAWASLSDYQQLSYNLNVNLCQGEETHCPSLNFKAGSIYALLGLRAATLLRVEI